VEKKREINMEWVAGGAVKAAPIDFQGGWAVLPGLKLRPSGRSCGLECGWRLWFLRSEKRGLGAQRYGLAGGLPGIENVDQRPGNAGQIVVKLSLLIDHELACRIEESRALGVVGVVQVELANREVKGLDDASAVVSPD